MAFLDVFEKFDLFVPHYFENVSLKYQASRSKINSNVKQMMVRKVEYDLLCTHYSTKVLASIMNFKKLLLSACITFLNSQGVQAIGTTIQTTFSAKITGGVGCQYGDQVGTMDGFGATFYSYPNEGSAGWTTTTGGKSIVNTDFFMKDYSEYGLETSTTGVFNPTFTCGKDEDNPDSTMEAFGVEVTVQHFLLELDGYFYAKVSGLYTLRLLAVDDLAAVWFGSGLSCCDSDVPNDSESPSFWASWDRTSNENGAAVANLYLTAGIYYPIKVRFANTNRAGALAFEVVDPSGNTINDFKGSVYRFVNIENRCTTVSATFPFSTITVSDREDSTFAVPTTTTNSAGDLVSTTVVIVEVSTTTKQTNTPTSTYTSDSTSSYSTSTMTSSSEVLSTITEDPDIPDTITTTKLTTFTNSDGSVETTRIVVIEVPGTTTTPANLTSTEVPQNTLSISTSEFVSITQTSILMSTSSSWESSLSSSSIIFWNSSIASTSSTTVIVSSTSSALEVLSTITEDPDISETITTTKLTTFTNSDGSVETTRIVVVEVPGTTTVSESTSEEESSTSATTSLTNGITSTENTSFTSSQTTESTSDASLTNGDNIVSVSTTSATPAISSESVLVSTSSNLGSSVASSSPVSTSSLTGSSTSSSSEVLSTITEDPDIPEVMTTTELTTFTNSDGSVETARIVVVEVPGSTTSSSSSIQTKSFISSMVTGNDTATTWRSLSTSQLESFSNTSAATSFEQSNKGPSFTETSSSIQSSSNTASAKTLVTSTINNMSSLSSETGKAEFSNTIDVSNTEATYGGASATTKSPYSSGNITSSPTQHHSTYPSTTITISQQSAEPYAGNTPQISIYTGGAAESSNLNKFYFAFALIALLPFA